MATSTVVYCALVVLIGAVSSRDGLRDNYLVLSAISAFEPLVIVGVFAATLSSALASLAGAPRVFQAVARDGVFPRLAWFGVGTGVNDEPLRAYAATFVVAVGCIWTGNLNPIAALITNFFLVSYALVNYACFAASASRAPGWRPSFRFYSMWASLAGALLCVAIMFLINVLTSIVTLVVCAALFAYVLYTKPDINWGSAAQAQAYVDALRATRRLDGVAAHVKNFRPQFLVLVKPEPREDANQQPNARFVIRLAKPGGGLVLLGSVVVGEVTAENAMKTMSVENRWKDIVSCDTEGMEERERETL